jgi:hypothetical protein
MTDIVAIGSEAFAAPLQPGRRQLAERQADRLFDRDDVRDVDRQAEFVRVAAHQLVGEEQGQERNPVAQEQPASAEDYRGESQADHDHVRRQRNTAGDHQQREKDGVGDHAAKHQPVVTPA